MADQSLIMRDFSMMPDICMSRELNVNWVTLAISAPRESPSFKRKN